MLVGRVEKSGTSWIAECEAARVWTMGRTRREAITDIAVVIELKVNKAGFKARAYEHGPDPAGGYAVWIESNDPQALAALVLLEEREWHHQSLADVAKALGASSRNAYFAYEQGRREPSLSKMAELLAAIGSDVVLVLAPKALLRGLSTGFTVEGRARLDTRRGLRKRRQRPKAKSAPAKAA